MSYTKNDPANYREISKPFESAQEANEAWVAFQSDVNAARQKHRIGDALVVVNFNVLYEGGEGSAISYTEMGDIAKMESLAAYALGETRARQRQYINRLISNQATSPSP